MTSVTVVGPGRVGGALAIALTGLADTQVTIVGRPGSPSRRTIADIASSVRIAGLQDAVATADVVIVCTPDDAIEGVARDAALADAIPDGQRWVHTAGGRGTGALSAVTAAGGRVAACHPAMTFPDPVTGAGRLRGTTWAVTCQEEDQRWAQDLITSLGGIPVHVSAENRVLYHAALTVGSNATTAVVTLARDMLLGAGITDPASFLTPLVTASAQGAAVNGVAALTGPVRRGDVGTVTAHLQELADALPEAVGVYLALCELVLSHAVRAGLDDDSAARIRAALRSS